jgi:hypothetical protein
VGETYHAASPEGTLSNASFLYVYWAGFGLMGVLISIGFLILLDQFVRTISGCPWLALPFIAVLALKAVHLSEGVFTTSLITGGYILLPIVAIVARIAAAPTRAGPSLRPTRRVSPQS